MLFKFKFIVYVIVNIIFVTKAHGNVISNLNFVFETFSPTSMVRFFEFNDVGWNITEKCIKDMFLYLDGLHKDILWAIKLYDAAGYYAGSIYAGNNLKRGDPQLCRDLNNDFNINEFRTKYGIGPTIYDEVQSYLVPSAVLPFPVQLVNARYKTIVESSPFHSYIIHQTVCMPMSCSHEDLLQVMSYANVSHLRNNLIMKTTELLDVRILSQTYEVYMDGAFCWFILLTSLFLFLGLFGTVLEYCMNFDVRINLMSIEHKNVAKCESISSFAMDLMAPKCNNFLSTSDTTTPTDSSSSTVSNCSRLRRFLLAFSWKKNFEILFSDSKKHCVNDVIEISGLRFITLLWILMVHICTVLYHVSDNKIYKHYYGFNIVQEFLESGSLAFDIHFFFCGICIAHMFFNRMKDVDMEVFCSCFDTLLHISSMIAYKVLSMTFPYIITLLLLQMCMKFYHGNSIVDIPSIDHETCQANMWRNIFYIDQFFPLEERCMLWSWVLSVEVQCFIVASVILLISESHPKFGIIIFGSFVTCSIVAMATLNIHGNEMNYNINSSLIMNEDLAFFNGLYEKPWARLSRYIFGIYAGYILHKIDGKIEISLIVMSCGWIACSFLFIVLVLSKVLGSSTTPEPVFPFINYAIWSLIILWLIVASISKHRGSIGRLLTSKYLLPLNKMSNCFLMLHPLITRIIILGSDASIHLSFAMIVTIYFGVAVLTVFSSFTLYMFYEAPVDELLRIVYNRKARY